MSNKKLVVVVEDSPDQRNYLSLAINSYGFKCVAEDTLKRTYTMLKEKWSDISVIILDMDLSNHPYVSDSDTSPTSGVDLINKVIDRKAAESPKIIVRTGHPLRLNYYIEAIGIGVAEFLYKEETDSEKIIPLIQNYSLIHSFNENLFSDEALLKVIEEIKSLDELLVSYFVDYLIEQLNNTFQSDSYILMCRIINPQSSADFIKIFSEIEELPSQLVFDYSELHQRIVYDSVDEFLEKNNTQNVFSKFSFATLAILPEIQITIGFKNPFPLKTERLVFQTKTIVEILKDRTKPVIERQLNKLIFLWKKEQKSKIEKVETLRDLNEAILARLSKILAAKDSRTLKETSGLLTNLKENSVANLHQRLSEYNSDLERILETGQASELLKNQKSLSEIVVEIQQKFQFSKVEINLVNNCIIPSDAYCFSLGIEKIFSWMASRFETSDNENLLRIKLDWTADEKWLEIHIKDHNRKRTSIRNRQFELKEPFSPLQVSKLFIETACRGLFIDASEELEENFGHFFKIKFLNI